VAIKLLGYPYKDSAFHYGTRNLDVLGIVAHMAEGGGTVSWLSGGNDPSKVSVGFVIEKSGRVVQMLGLEETQGGIKVKYKNGTSAIRKTNDPNGRYGRMFAKAVLGDGADNPNNCTIQVEIEGFASVGPNGKQLAAWVKLVADLRASTYQRMDLRGSLGHRDFQSYKACPGPSAAMKALFDSTGGHGIWKEIVMQSFTWSEKTAQLGHVVVKGKDHSYLRLLDNTLHPIAEGIDKPAFGPIELLKGIGDDTKRRRVGFLVADEAAFLLATDVTFTPGG
jgi:hypothetical protein